ncbi:MAG: hypothetical protein Fur0032_02120 [Terrimicrobiaceae bacterium]
MDGSSSGLAKLEGVMMCPVIHLDTNCMISYAGEVSESVVARVEEWIMEDRKLCCSAMAWAEFLCGPILPEEVSDMEALLNQVAPVTPFLALEGARLFKETRRRSRSLADCLIAATAIAAHAPLASNNRDNFAPFVPHGLELL